MKIKERTKAGVETEGRQAWRGRQAGERCHRNGIRSRAGSLRKRSWRKYRYINNKQVPLPYFISFFSPDQSNFVLTEVSVKPLPTICLYCVQRRHLSLSSRPVRKVMTCGSGLTGLCRWPFRSVREYKYYREFFNRNMTQVKRSVEYISKQ
jgi:hypothetical protein